MDDVRTVGRLEVLAQTRQRGLGRRREVGDRPTSHVVERARTHGRCNDRRAGPHDLRNAVANGLEARSWLRHRHDNHVRDEQSIPVQVAGGHRRILMTADDHDGAIGSNRR